MNDTAIDQKYMRMALRKAELAARNLPAYNHYKFFRVAEPAEPKFPAEDLYSIVAFNQKMTYNVEEFMARLTDNSEHMEFRPVMARSFIRVLSSLTVS